MARRPDTPCAICGRLLWGGSTSLPAGKRMCRPCKTLSRSWEPGNKAHGTCAETDCPRQIYAKRQCLMHYRKSRGFGGAIVSVRKRREILARDGYMCMLCGEPLDMSADPQDDMYPSLDHITPRSIGGTHSIDNLQAAHRICNARRKAKPLDQFLAV